MAENRSTTETMVLLAIGGVVGAALGILFAPAPGKETRENVGNWLKDQKEKGEDMWKEGAEKLAAKKEQVKAAYAAGRESYLSNSEKS
ncbi:MAG: YtxH domain-containing protein [Elusimicrobia bacterium]|nr:YtxH domain-containing protein [Elusimicrobiota bacterium]